MMRLNTLALAFSLLSLAGTAASAADLSITVKDVHNSTGTVYLVVYDETNFGKPQLAKVKQKAPAAKGDITIVFHDLPAGRYAVSSYQDENGNGKLDTNSLGVPTEGFGFSNDAQPAGGPPKFNQAAFDFDGKANKSISFSLNY